jgi:hypothetical protein
MLIKAIKKSKRDNKSASTRALFDKTTPDFRFLELFVLS